MAAGQFLRHSGGLVFLMVLLYTIFSVVSSDFLQKMIDFLVCKCYHIYIYIPQKKEGKMLKYKINVVEELVKHGYSTTKIRREKILGEATLTKIRAGDTSISTTSLGLICTMLRCQPGDVMENIITPDEKIKFFI